MTLNTFKAYGYPVSAQQRDAAWEKWLAHTPVDGRTLANLERRLVAEGVPFSRHGQSYGFECFPAWKAAKIMIQRARRAGEITYDKKRRVWVLREEKEE